MRKNLSKKRISVVRREGNSLVSTIPNSICSTIKIRVGESLVWECYEGKKGKYIAVYIPSEKRV